MSTNQRQSSTWGHTQHNEETAETTDNWNIQRGHLIGELANVTYKTMVILFQDISIKLENSGDNWKL